MNRPHSLVLLGLGALVSAGPAFAQAPSPAAPARPAPAIRIAAANAAPAEPTLPLFRIETARGVLYSSDHPMQSGELVSFHEHPSGTLMSIRRSEIRHVVVEQVRRSIYAARPGDAIDIGVTGGSGGKSATATGGKGGKTAPELGSRADGTALLNPDRKYQPDVDAKQVPGLNLGYPASPNDYREGRTIGYPAAPAVQSAPGEPPKMAEPKKN